MTIDNLKELKAIIALCRKQGVTAIEIDGIKLQLSASTPTSQRRVTPKDFDLELPPEASLGVPQYIPAAQADTIDTDELSQEQLLFYSSRPEDPTVKQ